LLISSLAAQITTEYLTRPTRRITPVKSSAGVWCRSSQEKVNAFAEHLRGSFQPFGPVDLQETSQFLDVGGTMGLPIPEIVSEEIKEEIPTLKPSKSPGYDRLDAAALKLMPQNCIKNLKTILNQSLRLGHYKSLSSQNQVSQRAN